MYEWKERKGKFKTVENMLGPKVGGEKWETAVPRKEIKG